MDSQPLGENDPSVIEGKVFAILGYLSILCIIPLILRKDNPFVLTHSKQGLVIFIGEVAVFILSIMFPWIFKLGLFVLSIMSFLGVIAALRGKYLTLPVVTEIAEKITL